MVTTTRDQIAVAAIQDILRREDYQPELLKDMAKALAKARNVLPPPDAIIVRNKVYSLKTIEERLVQFIHYLPPDNRPEITDTSFYDENFLNQLISIIDEVSGFAPSPKAKVSMDAVVPANLQELLEAQAKATAEKKQALGRPSQLTQQIKQAQEIGIRSQLLRVAVSRRLYLTLLESSYIKDLQVIYGKETVNQFLTQRIDLAVNQSITALAMNQLGLSDPANAAAYFTSQLEKNLKTDRNLAVALAKTPKISRKNALVDAKNLAGDAVAEIQPAAEAFRAEQDSSPIYRATAQEIAQGEIEAALAKSGQQLSKKQASRLADTLAKYSDHSDKQLLILKRILPGISPETGQEMIGRLQPAISALARSSDHPSIAETINEASLINLARTNPALFPFRLMAAIRGNRLSDGETVALTVRLSQQLRVSLDYVALRLSGINAKDLQGHLVSLTKGLPVLGLLPTRPPINPNSPIFRRLNDALPGVSQIDRAKEEFQFNPIASGLNLRSNWYSITHFFNVGKAIRYNLGRLPSINRMASSAQTVFSGLRIRSGIANSAFSFFTSVSGGIGKLRSAAAYPFRAVGSVISAGWSKAKSWAGIQVKAGLAKAGAWLAKKGVTAAATKLGLIAVGKGAAALLAQAVPIAGQIFAAALIGGDILKFLWNNRKEIGAGLAGMFFLGQMILAKILGFLGAAAWTLGGGILGGVIGFAIGGPIGAVVGTLVGGTIGYLISSGALGSALAGVAGWLGSIAVGIGSFIATITSPAALAGVAGTVATVSVVGAIGGGAFLAIQNQHAQTAALYVQTAAPDSFGRGRGADIPACWPTSGTIAQGPYNDRPIVCQSGGKVVTCSHAAYNSNAVDIAKSPVGEPVYASHDGVATAFAFSPVAEFGNYVIVQSSPKGFLTIYAHLLEFDLPTGVPTQITGGTRIGLMGTSGNSTGPHLHYELNNDGHIDTIVPQYNLYDTVAYDPVCIGQSSSSISGWISRVSGANNVIATTNTEYDATGGEGINACTWLEKHGEASVAVNANFFEAQSTKKIPRGPASYRLDPIPHSLDPRYSFWSIYASGSNFTLGPADIATRPHQFAVSGSPLLIRGNTAMPIPDTSDGPQHFVWHTKDTRLAMGFTGASAVIVVLDNATVKDMQKFLLSQNIQNAINLDGGSSATLCERTGSGVISIISTGRKSANSIGFIGGTIEKITGGLAPGP
ncbi:peptidoglycan DD-metalloendopeptidase family protein [Candidatus Collierbacteria bacterium]|nr:peptidoglycan DD-metalloendopeptidase family protein [Candidatus Collierbacteria bacterium]